MVPPLDLTSQNFGPTQTIEAIEVENNSPKQNPTILKTRKLSREISIVKDPCLQDTIRDRKGSKELRIRISSSPPALERDTL